MSDNKVVFLQNPNRVLEQLIKNFVAENDLNRRTQIDAGIYFEEPLVGFASGSDPLFSEYKTLIGPHHLTPNEIIQTALEKSHRPFHESEEVSVLSWVLPISKDIRKSNRRENQYPSQLWALTRHYGQSFRKALRKHVNTFLEDLGYLTVDPSHAPGCRYFYDEQAGWTSSWSERHIAYACGLGTFSLNDGLITPKGMAVNIGSLVTLLRLTPSEKPYRHLRENCLQFRDGKCRKCISRCPVGAIDETGHDKNKCYQHLQSEALRAKSREYGVPDSSYSCGLCQTGVPCEFEIPRPDLIA